jgi:hypothetical protein
MVTEEIYTESTRLQQQQTDWNVIPVETNQDSGGQKRGSQDKL